MLEDTLLARTLAVGSRGKDVDAAKRAVYRGLDKLDGGRRLKAHMRQPLAVRRTFGPFFRRDVNRLRARMGLAQSGRVDQPLWAAIAKAGYPDALAVSLLNEYRDERKPPKQPLVEPHQGFGSLHESLWEAYSIGRRMGLTDLGTYNPDSRLPGGGKSDHAFLPAFAFDLGFAPATGYEHPVARRFFRQMINRPEVNYVIVGNKIWSRELGEHPYTQGGHEAHVHVSGVRQ